ncbi:MAG: phage tail protein I [Pseudomonadota bacterium]
MTDLRSILPPNATALERTIDRVAAGRLDSLSLAISALWSADEALEDHLPWLASAVSVDVWNSRWPEHIKRQAIKTSFEVHRLKGTFGAVRRALDSLGVRSVLTEWFEEDGAPYTFRVRAYAAEFLDLRKTVLLDAEFESLLREVVDAVKPVRAQFEFELAARSPITFAPLALTSTATVTRRCVQADTEPIRPSVNLSPVAALRALTVCRRDVALGGL